MCFDTKQRIGRENERGKGERERKEERTSTEVDWIEAGKRGDRCTE